MNINTLKFDRKQVTNMSEKYTCHCCGYKSLDEDGGSYEICDVCFWEDDFVMNEEPDYWGGANGVCLRLAQRNFYKFGVSEEKYRDRIVNVRYEKDTLWKPIWEIEEKLNKKKLTEIIIEGNILISGFNKSLKIDNFLDEFTVFLENKGYSFGGIIKQNETEIDIEQE